MGSTRRATTAAVSLSLALTGVAATAHAGSSKILYVDKASAACVDSGTGAGTAATPFCTIQDAANVVAAGDTVDIEAGDYTAAVDVTTAGAADAPIVFQAVDGQVIIGGGVGLEGASYVTFEGAETGVATQELRISKVTVDDSSHDTFDRTVLGTSEVTGTSTDAAFTRNWVRGSLTVDAGSSGDVISTNWFEAETGAISVTDASNIAITSNNIEGNFQTVNAVGVYGASTGVTIENNIVTYPSVTTGSDAEIAVDAAAAPGTTLDYNVVWPHPEDSSVIETEYSWAGVTYASAAALYKATGQAQHDINANPELYGGSFSDDDTAPQLNSANSSAPGMLSTDMYGASCSGDPVVAASGAGTPAYCARGAVQGTYTTDVIASAAATDALSVSLTSGVSQYITAGGTTSREYLDATPVVSYTVNWGDGTTKAYAQGVDQASHTYAKMGTYTITDMATLTNGTTAVTTTSVTTAGSGFTAYGPTRILDTRKGIGAAKAKLGVDSRVYVKVAGVGSIPSDVTAVAVNLTATNTTGGGYVVAGGVGTYASTSNVNYGKGQTVANNAIVPVNSDGTIELVNEGSSGDTIDLIADISGYFTQSSGNGYTPVALKRLLDTRNGTGASKAKVAAGGHVSLTIAGADSIPSGVKAVAVHVTETDATGGGFIAAEADGAGVPTTSSLNFSTGQTISNTVIVPVASDGKIELYNGAASGSVDLVADVSGYFSASSTEAYVPLTADRVFDSRDQGELYPNSVTELWLADWTTDDTENLIPSGATVITNITITGTQAAGYLTVYPDETAAPGVSDLNFLKGQTVANLGLLTTTGAEQGIDVANHSSGYDELILDVDGYFANS
ncbi:right-handed parallel beta-helix repeat-containing protein [Actinospica sp. MGRD01-02]|uniref:Right-handed parallel beta-helix repeat-containing protein n=1 Tax=Actinospica acidithermotolerans TaxID=2828514 RepID=A0A941E266_9ACTN|nr:right-handed parallel beta-helix repeat-containing protein [Actinospica acidithermotolerans]MBR7824750.1 right-handed parallel beta-helix repeat-containing protein [Actinospica acidithermotolerans]